MRSQFMVDIAFLNSPEVAHAGEDALGAWLRLQSYAAQQGHGGRVADCRAWDNRRWMVTARAELPAIEKAVGAGLLLWDGQDLLIEGYDDRGEELYKAKSEGGKKGKRRQLENQRSRESHGESHRVDAGIPTAPILPSPVLASPVLAAKAQEASPPPLPEDAFARADQAASPKRRHTLGDLEACHSTLVIFRDDRDTAETLLTLYGWDACNRGVGELTPAAKTRPHGKQRVTISELRGWLGERFELDTEDYKRVGLTMPAPTAKAMP